MERRKTWPADRLQMRGWQEHQATTGLLAQFSVGLGSVFKSPLFVKMKVLNKVTGLRFNCRFGISMTRFHRADTAHAYSYPIDSVNRSNRSVLFQIIT